PVNTAAELIGLNFDGARLVDRNLPEAQQGGQNGATSNAQPSTTPNYAIQLGAELNLPIDLAALDFGQGQFDIPLGEIHQITHNWAYLDPANVQLSFSYRVKTAADLEVLHVFYIKPDGTEVSVGDVSLSSTTSDFVSQTFTIPNQLLGKVAALSFKQEE